MANDKESNVTSKHILGDILGCAIPIGCSIPFFVVTIGGILFFFN